MGRAVERERPGVFVPVGVDLVEIGADGPVRPDHVERAADRDRAVLLGEGGAGRQSDRQRQGGGPSQEFQLSHRIVLFEWICDGFAYHYQLRVEAETSQAGGLFCEHLLGLAAEDFAAQPLRPVDALHRVVRHARNNGTSRGERLAGLVAVSELALRHRERGEGGVVMVCPAGAGSDVAVRGHA